MRPRSALFLALILFGAAGGRAAEAQAPDSSDADSLRRRYLLPVPPALETPSIARRPAPAMGANSPLAFGGRLGDVFFAAGATTQAREVDAVDGMYGVGFSLGDPDRAVGVDVAVISFSSFRSGFWKRGGIDVQISRNLPEGFAIAVGWETAVSWGMTDGGESRYAVLSKWLPLGGPDSPGALVLSAGVGDGRFLRFDDFASGARKVNLFGSVGVRVLEPLSLVADWTGQDLTALASVAPFRRFPLVLSFGAADLTGASNQRTPRLVGSASVSFGVGEVF